MAERTNREIIDIYSRAMETNDIPAVMELLHPDYIEDYPQSGERIRGRENFHAVMTQYPGGEPQTTKVERIVGTADHWIVTPMYTSLRVDGAGDEYSAVARVTYPDGSDWFVVQFIRLHEGAIYRTTSYYGQPFPAPDWRKPYVETIPTNEVGR